MSFGLLLKETMQTKRKTQMEVAEILNTKQSAISEICNGKRVCATGLATRLADALELQGAEKKVFIIASIQERYANALQKEMDKIMNI